ncbi:MAG TPA: Lrp/AsnC family transcriptional regulator [Longimicrobiaceae bacterium]|nr:Lrp/AsnC family transcriptional regulator [Longimicrobiaceae bacterium]
MARIDGIDLHLLTLLQENGRASQQELAHAVGLSGPAVGDRLRKLEEAGIIRHFTVALDPKKLGRDVTAFLAVGISGSQHYPDFLGRVAVHPEILECHSVTGQGSHLLKVRTENTSSLERLLAEIQAWEGVQWTQTSIVLSTIKETSRLELDSPPRT